MSADIGCILHCILDRWHIACGAICAQTNFDSGIKKVANAALTVPKTRIAIGVVGDAGVGRPHILDVLGLQMDAVSLNTFIVEQAVCSVHVGVAIKLWMDFEHSL